MPTPDRAERRAAEPPIVALLRPWGEPADDGAEAWQRWHRARITYWAAFYDRYDAERLAFGEALSIAHARHGAAPVPGLCGGCGLELADRETLTLGDDATVHFDHGTSCLTRYGERWRRAAAERLDALGIPTPGGYLDD